MVPLSYHSPIGRLARSAVLVIVPLVLSGCVESVGPGVPGDDPEPVARWEERPDPPARFSAYGKDYVFDELVNPVWLDIADQFKTEPEAARERYASTVSAGGDLYYQNCVHCHGDLLDGVGLVSLGQTPPPANFRGDNGIGRVTEPYLFWRITTGAPGLPQKFTPWNSMMPVGQDLVSEGEVWQLIMFLYDRIGRTPRTWNEQIAGVATALHAEAQAAKAGLSGMDLYLSHCAVCHGETGAGDGPAAAFLYPVPRDFSIGLFKYKTSDFEIQQPMDDDLFRAIKFGLTRTAMPAWQLLLDDEKIRELVEVVKRLDYVGTWAPEDAPDSDFDEEGYYQADVLSFDDKQPVGNPVPFSDESVAEGRRHFEINCTPCHGDEGRGSPSAEKKLRDDWGARIWPRDLTKPWTWRVTEVDDDRDRTIRNIFTRLSVGIPGTPMPEHASGVPEEARWQIASYVHTLRATTPKVSASPVIHPLRVEGSLPDGVNDTTWATAEPMTIVLVPNVVGVRRLFKPLNDSMSVRVLYNDDAIAFLLEMDDRTYSRPGDPEAETIRDPDLEMYPDAFAIQLPKTGSFALAPTADLPLFRHGDEEHPTTMWYWRTESVDPAIAPITLVMDATGEDDKLQPRPDDRTVSASGEWVNGRWRVLVKRRRIGADSRDLIFSDGVRLPVSFASWDGSNGEAGAKHMLSSWYWLKLPDMQTAMTEGRP